MYSNSRTSPRFNVALPIHLSFGSQVTLQGQIKDLSLKSAFINVKSSVPMELHDELDFNISNSINDLTASIQGKARISRISAGEGIAIYFTKMDEASSSHLERLIGAALK